MGNGHIYSVDRLVDVDADDWHFYFFDELSKLAIKLNFETLLEQLRQN
jgi:hypothetical protein